MMMNTKPTFQIYLIDSTFVNINGFNSVNRKTYELFYLHLNYRGGTQPIVLDEQMVYLIVSVTKIEDTTGDFIIEYKIIDYKEPLNYRKLYIN